MVIKPFERVMDSTQFLVSYSACTCVRACSFDFLSSFTCVSAEIYIHFFTTYTPIHCPLSLGHHRWWLPSSLRILRDYPFPLVLGLPSDSSRKHWPRGLVFTVLKEGRAKRARNGKKEYGMIRMKVPSHSLKCSSVNPPKKGMCPLKVIWVVFI